MSKQTDFISQVAPYVVAYAASYGIKVHSPIIAQACLESAWGGSSLAYKYHNYFGLKAGSKWTGQSVNMNTKEWNGKYYSTTSGFRAYGSMADGIQGYFQFINTSRYSNLKGVTDPQTYLTRIKADGYATAPNYVQANMSVINSYGLTKYDRMTASDFASLKNESTSSVLSETTNEPTQLFTAEKPDKIKEWGLLQYFESVDTPSIAQAKANMLLELYARKTRTLSITNAFGDKTVRGGTLIPVQLNLGDLITNNYMLVDKVTHRFSKDSYTMDLSLEGAWED